MYESESVTQPNLPTYWHGAGARDATASKNGIGCICIFILIWTNILLRNFSTAGELLVKMMGVPGALTQPQSSVTARGRRGYKLISIRKGTNSLRMGARRGDINLVKINPNQRSVQLDFLRLLTRCYRSTLDSHLFPPFGWDSPPFLYHFILDHHLTYHIRGFQWNREWHDTYVFQFSPM